MDAITWVGALVNVGLAGFKVSLLLYSVALSCSALCSCSSVRILYDGIFLFFSGAGGKLLVVVVTATALVSATFAYCSVATAWRRRRASSLLFLLSLSLAPPHLFSHLVVVLPSVVVICTHAFASKPPIVSLMFFVSLCVFQNVDAS